MRKTLWVIVLAGCAAGPRPPSPAANRWVFRTYTSGIESTDERVTTLIVDEGAGAVDATVRTRTGRNRKHLPWTEGAPAHWKLAVSRGGLSLTAADGTESRYACAMRDLEVAPATAVRVSLGGESEWKQGRWDVPTRRIAMQVCHLEGNANAAPPELLLAAEPIEHLIADDNCCKESPSLRLVPADGGIAAPRDKNFPGPDGMQ
jgi:hypothetical protein